MPLKKPKADTADQPAKPKKAKPPKEKKPKAPKEKKPKKPKPPKGKKVKKGQNLPADGADMPEEGEQPKKIKPILLLIPVVLVAAAVLVFLFVIRPRLAADDDPDASASVEPQPPALPTEILVGDTSIVGMALEADESGALAEKSKRVTYTYTNLNDAGKAAQTYARQLAAESPAFSLVDEEFVRVKEQPDYSTEEGMVLFARNVPQPEPEKTDPPETESAEPSESPDPDESAEPAPTPTPEPEPEPTEEPVTYVITVRITWSPGQCVVTADEEVGKVTSPPVSSTVAKHPLTQRGAVDRLKSMDPAALGLNGTSMDQYEIIVMAGTEMMDGRACYRLHAYGVSDNYQVMGSYLFSIDGEHLYRLDPVVGEAVELDYTPE